MSGLKSKDLLRVILSSISTVTRLRTRRPKLDSRQGFFLSATAYRPALGPTQPMEWIPVALYPEVKWPEREADHSPQPSAEVKKAWSYTFTPCKSSWCGA